MDTKRLLTTILIAGALYLLMRTFFPSGGGATAAAVKTGYSLYAGYPARPQEGEQGEAPKFVTLGSSTKPGFLMAVTVSTATAGIDSVELNIANYAETPKRDKPLTLFAADPLYPRPFSTIGVRIQYVGGAENSAALLQNQYVWKIVNQSDTEVKLQATILIDGKPAARVYKTFTISPTSYDVKIAHSVENLSDQPIQIAIDQLGPSELPRDDPQADDRFFHGMGLDSAKSLLDPKRFNTTQVELGKFPTLSPPGTKGIGGMSDYKSNPVLWVASSNRFFVTVVRPLPSSPTAARVAVGGGKTVPEATHIGEASLDLVKWAEKPSDELAVVRFTGAKVEVPAGATIDEPMSVFMGPKKRDLLNGNMTAAVDTEEYTRSVLSYISVIQLNQGGCYSFCTWDQLAWVILRLLDFLAHSVAFGNYGVAIMILVIVVRAILHPLTRASQINMAKMSKSMKDLQPQLDAVKKRYAAEGQKKKQQEEIMRVYRENKVNPAGGLLGCLPMLIQMPIWAALWSGLRTDIDLRHAAFIPGWINDLSHPDTILPRTLPVLGHPLFTLPLLGEIYGLNLLPLLLAGVFFVQMKVTTASQPKATDPQQAQMQKMSQYMIFLFPLFLYSAPSGLNLYIFASTMGGLVDTWLVRKSLKKKGILPANAQALPTHEETPAAE